MNIELLLVFIGLSIVNVILQTIKSIATVKCGKGVASLLNAVAFGLYTVVTVYTMCDLPLFVKAFVVAFCNLVGVYIVKFMEEKARKDKLWKVELTVRGNRTPVLARELEELDIPFNYIDNVGKYTVFNIYCATQKESAFVRELTTRHNAKYFVTESKNL